MESFPRHQCLIYEGAPSRHLPAMAAVAREKLHQNYRCLYLNSPPMVAGMRSYMAAAGVDIAHEVERMLLSLEEAIQQALRDGYAGLWATGDMTWELGEGKDFSKLLEYEWRLEKIFGKYPELSGICQYHASTMPREAMRHGLVAHPSIFFNETLSMVNPHYVRLERFSSAEAQNAELDSVIGRLCHPEGVF
jgi:hypothetical protein